LTPVVTWFRANDFGPLDDSDVAPTELKINSVPDRATVRLGGGSFSADEAIQ